MEALLATGLSDIFLAEEIPLTRWSAQEDGYCLYN